MKYRENRWMRVLFSLLFALGLLSGISFVSYAHNTLNHEGDGFNVWIEAYSLPTHSGKYYLAGDVELNSTWEVSHSVELCLNGHSITYKGVAATNSGGISSVICVRSGGSLTLYDCGNIQHNYSINDDGLVTVLSLDAGSGKGDGSFTGGYITGGGGVYDSNNNTSTKNNGGGVYVDEGAAFTMTGGNIIGNKAAKGGGVYVGGGTFTMTGGKIIHNVSDSCGGVLVDKGVFKVSGNPVITDNTEGKAKDSNVCVKKSSDGKNDTFITISGNLADTSKMGVTLINNDAANRGTRIGGVFTSGGKGSSQTAKNFTSDDTNYKIWVNKDKNELALGKPCKVSFNVNGRGTAPNSQTVYEGDKVTKPADPTADGWTFVGWCKEEACRNAWDFDKDTVTGNTTLYAKWTKIQTITNPSQDTNPAEIPPAMTPPSIATAPPVNTKVTISKQTYKVLSAQKVALTKAKNAKTVTVPNEIIIEGVKLKVVSVSAGAFSKSKAKTAVIGSNINQLCAKAFTKSRVSSVVLKTDKLTKKSTKNCMKGSKIKKVTFTVKLGNKKKNNKYVCKYKKIFTKKNIGVKAKVKK